MNDDVGLTGAAQSRQTGTFPPPEALALGSTVLNQSQTNWSYETAVAQIEAIIAQIEAGNLDLAEVFDQFAAAVEQLRQCETFLNERQQQLDILIETLLDEPESF